MFYSTVTMWLSKLLSISQCDFSSQDFDCQKFYFISYNMILSQNCDIFTAVTISILTLYLKMITYIHYVTLYLTM